MLVDLADSDVKTVLLGAQALAAGARVAVLALVELAVRLVAAVRDENVGALAATGDAALERRTLARYVRALTARVGVASASFPEVGAWQATVPGLALDTAHENLGAAVGGVATSADGIA